MLLSIGWLQTSFAGSRRQQKIWGLRTGICTSTTHLLRRAMKSLLVTATKTCRSWKRYKGQLTLTEFSPPKAFGGGFSNYCKIIADDSLMWDSQTSVQRCVVFGCRVTMSLVHWVKYSSLTSYKNTVEHLLFSICCIRTCYSYSTLNLRNSVGEMFVSSRRKDLRSKTDQKVET